MKKCIVKIDNKYYEALRFERYPTEYTVPEYRETGLVHISCISEEISEIQWRNIKIREMLNYDN